MRKFFSSIVRFTLIHLILAIIVSMDLKLHQMDIKTRFQNGDLEEEIYMQQPVSFIKEGQENKVCKLLKFIYA